MYSYMRFRQLCKEPMTQLIRKYNLQGKKVFSKGPSFGHECYWFHKNGCSLTFVDVDEAKFIEPYLKTLPPSSSPDCLTFFIGDAFKYLRKGYSKREFDVFYVSSFTPGELRRRDIQAEYSPLYKKAINHLSYKMLNKKFFRTWPKAAYPFMDELMDLIAQNLKDSGLFIYQSYAYGVDVKSNPHFVRLAESQLKENGVILLKVYCLKAVPQDTLTIGFKGTEAETLNYLKKIKKNKDILTFHGRHPASILGCEVVYDYEQGLIKINKPENNTLLMSIA